MHGDEPDNAQAVPTRRPARGLGPADPAGEDRRRLRADQSGRPDAARHAQPGPGRGQGQWVGRGPARGPTTTGIRQGLRHRLVRHLSRWPACPTDDAGKLWYVPQGVDRLRSGPSGSKIVWNCIECTAHLTTRRPWSTPAQVKAEVWMALIHGSKGLIYFVHQFKPTFKEWACWMTR